MPTLEERVTTLEQQLAGTTPDSVTADVGQTVGPGGELSYEFNGHVKAAGLDLDAGGIAQPDDRKVRWISTVDGTVVAELVGVDIAGNHGLSAKAIDGATNAGMRAGALDGRATVLLEAGQGVTAIDEDGRSSFLQLPNDNLGQPRQVYADWGTAILTFTGGGTATATVPHRLPLTTPPEFAIAQAIPGGGLLFNVYVVTVEADDTDVTITAQFDAGEPDIGGTYHVQWLVIGAA